ncbi:MAG: type transporter [Deltaproteobacteria bacterium]|nr:type transporter [Deltaproteobacteria bacterium]
MAFIHQITAIAIKEMKVLCHDRQALALLFLMPVFFILVMSFALEGVFDIGTKSRPLEVFVVNQDKGKQADITIGELKKLEGFSFSSIAANKAGETQTIEHLVARGKYRFALIFPDSYSDCIQVADPNSERCAVSVRLFADPTVNYQLVTNLKNIVHSLVEQRLMHIQLQSRLQKAFKGIDNKVASLGIPIGTMKKEFEKTIDINNLLDPSKHRNAVTIEFPGGINTDRRPTSVEQNVPAYTIFGVFLIILTLAKSLSREKTEGTLPRLMAAPLTKAIFLFGKLLPYYLVNLIQIGLMFLVGVLVFKMRTGHIYALFLVSCGLAAAANGLGLLVAAAGKTEAQVETLAVLLAVTLAALGGMMVPSFIMPGFLKTIAWITPHAWALSGYQDIIVRGLSISEILPETFALMGFAVVFFSVALLRFRFN